MDNLPNNIDLMRRRKNSLPSNKEIQEIYFINQYSQDNEWLNNLFNKIKILAISRIKKIKKNYEKEDLLQSIYLEIWIALNSFDPHKNFDFYRWLNWHISRAVRNFFKKEELARPINLSLNGTSKSNYSLDNIVLFGEMVDAAAEISERDKRIPFQYFMEEKTLSELALEWNLTPEGIRKVYQKSIKIIKNNIGE